jgi:hypothetical protein
MTTRDLEVLFNNSIPHRPYHLIVLMDGHLTKTRGGKKGQIRLMIRFRVPFQRQA